VKITMCMAVRMVVQILVTTDAAVVVGAHGITDIPEVDVAVEAQVVVEVVVTDEAITIAMTTKTVEVDGEDTRMTDETTPDLSLKTDLSVKIKLTIHSEVRSETNNGVVHHVAHRTGCPASDVVNAEDLDLHRP